MATAVNRISTKHASNPVISCGGFGSQQMTTQDTGNTVILLGIAFVVYFLPSMVALGRGHHNAGAIALLNAIAGWTLVGWIIALVWAATAVSRAHRRAAVLAPSVLLLSLLCAGFVVFETPIGSLLRDRGKAFTSGLAEGRANLPASQPMPERPLGEGNGIKVFHGTGAPSDENPPPQFVVKDDWELRWEFRIAPLYITVERADWYVTLDQIASIVSKSERTVEKWKHDKRNPLPAPDVQNPDRWDWSRIRPWLEAKTHQTFPGRNPTSFIFEPGRSGTSNFAHGGRYFIGFVHNEFVDSGVGPWKFEIVQLTNRIE
jgi:hypothetical protein